MTDRRFETINKTLEALSSRLDRAFKRIEDFKQGRIDYMVKVNTLEQLLKDHFAKCPYMKGAPHGGRRKKRRKSRRKSRRKKRRSKRRVRRRSTTKKIIIFPKNKFKIPKNLMSPMFGWSPPQV